MNAKLFHAALIGACLAMMAPVIPALVEREERPDATLEPDGSLLTQPRHRYCDVNPEFNRAARRARAPQRCKRGR